MRQEELTGEDTMRVVGKTGVLALFLVFTFAGSQSYAQQRLTEMDYTPLIVPPDEISAAVMLEGNCVSASMKVVNQGRHTDVAAALDFNLSCSGAMWCRDARPDWTIYELGTRLPTIEKEGLTAREVVSELRGFVQSGLDSVDPMDTGRAILATETGQLLTQLKQTIKKAYGIMGNSSAEARSKLGERGGHIVDTILLFEAAALQFEELGTEIRKTVHENEFYDLAVDETGVVALPTPMPRLVPTFIPPRPSGVGQQPGPPVPRR
jgi:hypothetical protein